jgi:hypothetical protein
MLLSILALFLGLLAGATGLMGFGGYIFGIPSILIGAFQLKKVDKVVKVLGGIALGLGAIGFMETTAALVFVSGLTKGVEEIFGEIPKSKRVAYKICNVGDRIKRGELIFVIEGIYNYYPSYSVEANERGVIVRISVTNASNKEVEISSLYFSIPSPFRIRYPTEYGYDEVKPSTMPPPIPIIITPGRQMSSQSPQSMTDIYPPFPSSGVLLPGRTVRGHLYFDIPLNVKSFQLIYYEKSW